MNKQKKKEAANGNADGRALSTMGLQMAFLLCLQEPERVFSSLLSLPWFG